MKNDMSTSADTVNVNDLPICILPEVDHVTVGVSPLDSFRRSRRCVVSVPILPAISASRASSFAELLRVIFVRNTGATDIMNTKTIIIIITKIVTLM